MLIEKKNFNKINLINSLIALIPFSLILGNLAVNINVILICVVGITIYKLNTFKIDKKIYQYLIYGFFLYIILITLIRNLPNLNDNVLYKEHIIKAFFFLRFLILFLVINKLLEKNHFNSRFFFISCAFFSLIIAIDILIQISFGKNLLGNTYEHRPTSFFGSEDIAGSYLQKISLFFIFLIAFLKKNKTTKYAYILFSFLFFLAVIVLINNRIPVIFYIGSFFIFLFITRNFKTIIAGFLLSFVVIISLYNSNEKFNENYSSFIGNSRYILKMAPRLFLSEEISETVNFGSGHLLIFNSSVQIWKKNKIFGSGLKSFRLNCKYIKNQTCSSHPHNYILELLLDTGLLGLILIYLIFFISTIDYIKFFRKNLDLEIKLKSLPFFLIIFLEFFPLRSSGSFFTTSVATIIFLMLAILIGITEKKIFKSR